MIMLEPDDQKRLYENLDMIASLLNDDTHGDRSDALADMMMAITGLETDSHGLVWLDPSTRDDANRVATRWLRDHKHLPAGRVGPRVKKS